MIEFIALAYGLVGLCIWLCVIISGIIEKRDPAEVFWPGGFVICVFLWPLIPVTKLYYWMKDRHVAAVEAGKVKPSDWKSFSDFD